MAEPRTRQRRTAPIVNIPGPENGATPVVDSATVDSWFGSPPKAESPATEPTPTPVNVGEAIDAAIPPSADEPGIKGLKDSEKPDKQGSPRATPPKLDEWMDFFSRIVIRFLTEWYADYAFRGIDDSIIKPEDLAKINLTKDDRDTIARPFAEYANKNTYLRKHGREVIAISDSFESIVILTRWFSRVNRIARKYSPAKPIRVQQEARRHDEHHAESRTGGGSANGQSYPTPAGGFTIINPGGG